MDGTTNSMNISLSKLWEMVKGREARRAAVHRDAESDLENGQQRVRMQEGSEKKGKMF